MYLKSLILKGFKSFADRSLLEFEPGIAAVVGPNGSGKSNISDAVLWVLGERNVKNLRGQAMEDVIFSGSSARKPVGIAEVELVLNNSDHTLPIDFDEVSIARRMYRSGESEYLINGAIVRRLDVLDILHDTGLGTGTHSIISQGSLDTILQSKPEDRRSLIEEAAGVLKHKQRKQKSERKLEQMDNHLMRVQDIANEVERQLKPLERKAKRAQAYQGLSKELADLNLSLAVDELRTLKEKWQKAIDVEEILVAQLSEKQESIKTVEEEMQRLQDEVAQRNLNVNDIAKESRRAQTILERFDSMKMLLLEKERSAIDYETETRIVLETNKSKQHSLAQGVSESKNNLSSLVSEREEAHQFLHGLEEEHRELSQQVAKIEVSLEELSKSEESLRRGLEDVGTEKRENLETLSNSRAHEKLIKGHHLELEARIKRAKSELDESEQNTNRLLKRLEDLQKEEKEARLAVSEHYTQRERNQNEVDELRQQSSLVEAEIKGIEERERQRESSSAALSWLIENKSSFDEQMTFFSHVIKAPAELNNLVETLLGTDLHAFVVSNLSQANKIAKALSHRDEAGQIALLSFNDSSLLQQNKQSSPELGEKLLSFLTYEDQYHGLIETLLGDVYLCKDSREAQKAQSKYPSGYRFATREGYIVWSDCKVSIGDNSNEGESILALHSRLTELQVQATTLNSKLAEREAQKEEEDKQLSEAQNKSLQVAQEAAQVRGALNAAQEEQKRANEKLDALQRELADLELQKSEAQTALEFAQPKAVELEKRSIELTEKIEKTKEAIQENNAALKPFRERNKTLLENISSARLLVATLTERETYANRMIESNATQEKVLRNEYRLSLEVLAKKRILRKRAKPLLAQFEDLALSVKKRVDALEEGVSQAQDSTSGLNSVINETRVRARQGHDEANELNERLAESKVEKGRLELQVETAVASIVHDCRTPLETALALPVLEDRREVEETVFKLRRKIANMGTINPDAAVEYEELKTRFDYLSEQLDDVKYARRSLEKIIRVIDARMKEAFLETFDQVNANFKEIFEILFPGGSAELLLSDKEDLEQTGVEISAQPRGKKITKMMLMSGGEKSLTALALLFAVYRIRSTPFYILDEVEAALDDSNLRRLCAYFVAQRDDTQLILITHQRRTMEIADVLYGVSMQADGVTHVIGQKLDQVTE